MQQLKLNYFMMMIKIKILDLSRTSKQKFSRNHVDPYGRKQSKHVQFGVAASYNAILFVTP